MESFINNLQIKIEEHEILVEKKIYFANQFNNLVNNGGNNLLIGMMHYQYEMYQNKVYQRFIDIVSDCYNYVKNNKINYEDLEYQFRKKNMNIYIIARKFIKTNKNVFCRLHDEDKEYEANFVVTKDIDYYNSELKKFGYEDPKENYKNINKCGSLMSQDIRDAQDNFPNDEFILKDNANS